MARLSIHMIVGVLIGLIYYRVGNDAAHVFDNFGLLYFCIMFLMFTAFSSMILTCKWMHDIEHKGWKKAPSWPKKMDGTKVYVDQQKTTNSSYLGGQ